MATSRSAFNTCRFSISLPSTTTMPLPSSAAPAWAAMIFFDHSTSSGDGELIENLHVLNAERLVRPWRWWCGTISRFFVHGAWPAPRGVRSVVSAARYVGFPGPMYLTPLSLAERFLGDNNILCFRHFFA